MPIIVTERAAEEAKKLIVADSKLDAAKAGIRVGLQGGGCAGFSYNLDLAPEAKTNDKVCEDKGVRVFCDFKSYLYLNGMTLDYEDTPFKKGFVFNNPNAKSSCGCGKSVGF